MIVINPSLIIPEREISFTFARSGGPGGQNVNKVNTRATLWFNVWGSPTLTRRQKEMIAERLSGRINRNGMLQVVSYRHRTQAANRTAALKRFIQLLNQALAETKPRKRTRPSKKSREKRLSNKKHRGRIKQQRRAVKEW